MTSGRTHHPALRTPLLLLVALTLTLSGTTGCSLLTDDGDSDDLEVRARYLMSQTPLVDGHNDLPWQIRKRADGDVTKLDLRQSQPELHTDIPRLRAGGLGAQFWSVFIPTSISGTEAVQTTLEQIDVVHQMARHYPDVFRIALTAKDIERAHERGLIASLIGMEGGHSINGSLQVLRMFYEAGARYMTLTHSKNTPWADSCTDEPKVGGLSPFGEKVVREMNRIGMLVDLSHVSADTMRDALRVSRAPIIFSHSSARAITDHVRDVPDDVLKILSRTDGIVMVTFVPSFVNEEVRIYGELRQAERDRLRTMHPADEQTVTSKLQSWTDQNPRPQATLSDVADHIDHINEVAGIEHIGIGSDFDGISSVPVGLEDVSRFKDLVIELLERGYSNHDVRLILGGNLLRVMKKVERVSSMMRTRP